MESSASPLLWMLFLGLVALMLALDLGVFHRKAHRVGMTEAAVWSAIWVALAIGFNAGVYAFLGQDRALAFTTAYLLEKALAIDNVFVFAMIFAVLRIPSAYQHRVLFWGVLGALVVRAGIITVGINLTQPLHWVAYPFGALLIITGARFFVWRDSQGEPGDSSWVRRLGRWVPLTRHLSGDRFFVHDAGRLAATPLFVALIAVELFDVVFAFDSIPAIFGVTRDPFIVFTSNIFAVLGLRAMYFLLANVLDEFAYLKQGLSAVLVFVGIQMLITDFVEIPVGASLGLFVVTIGTAVLASMVHEPAGPDSGRRLPER